LFGGQVLSITRVLGVRDSPEGFFEGVKVVLLESKDQVNLSLGLGNDE